MNTDKKEDIAVFFDFENIALSLRHLPKEKLVLSAIYKKCEAYGRVVVANAYADWSNYSNWLVPLKASGFNPVYVPSFTYEGKNGKKNHKNAVDLQLSIEMVDVMHTQPRIHTYILITGDKDFVPVVDLLRKYGKRVLAMGVDETTSAHLIQAADEFISYADLENGISKEKKIYETLAEVVRELYKTEGNTVFSRVKEAMMEEVHDFDEQNYSDRKGRSFSRFKDFILEAQDLGYVQYVSNGTINEVLPPGVKVERGLPVPSLMDLDQAFDFLAQVARDLEEEGKSMRATSLKTRMLDMRPGFDEKEIRDEEGKFFENFSHFARAAQRRGLVDVEGHGFDMRIYPHQPEAKGDQSAQGSDPTVRVPQPEMPKPKPETRRPIRPERVLIIDAIRQSEGPTPAHTFGKLCQQLRDERNIDLPNRRINQLLSDANQAGIIQPAQESKTKFVFVDDPTLISKFLIEEA